MGQLNYIIPLKFKKDGYLVLIILSELQEVDSNKVMPQNGRQVCTLSHMSEQINSPEVIININIDTEKRLRWAAFLWSCDLSSLAAGRIWRMMVTCALQGIRLSCKC